MSIGNSANVAIGKKEIELYTRAISQWGSELQMDLLVEEMAELISEIVKFKRDRVGVFKVCGELADVIIMIRQVVILLQMFVDDKATGSVMERTTGGFLYHLNRKIEEKLERLESRLDA